jgi:DNA polymerase-3 subunit beta
MTTIIVPRESLSADLAFCGSAVQKRHTNEILKNVLLTVKGSELLIRATDLELTAYASVLSVEDTPRSDGEFTVELSPLLAFARTAPEEFVTMTESAGYVTLTSGGAKLKLPTLPAQDFPGDPRESSGDESVIATLPIGRLKALLDATAYAVNEEEKRYQVNGCLIAVINRKLESVSTDGHRMGIASTSGAQLDGEARVFLPKCGLIAVTGLPAADAEECTLSESENGITIACGIRAIYVRKVDINFPAYREAIPKSFDQSAELSVPRLLAAVRRTLVAAATSKAVLFTFTPGKLKLMATDAVRSAEEMISVDYSGPEIAVGLGGNYVTDVLSAVACENVRVQFTDGQGAVVITPVSSSDEDLEQLHLVMPMRTGKD